MVTLKTLPQASAQEVFDHVANHLLTQMKQSTEGGNCSYRGDNGLVCAAGCLLAEHEYQPDFEGMGWLTLVDQGDIPEQHASLIQRLQGVHDMYDPEQWRERLQMVSKDYNLTWN